MSAEVEPIRRICVECRHCSTSNRHATWYDYTCGSPELRGEPTTDPVSGRLKVFRYNGLGQRYTAEPDEQPHCREINLDGRCKLWEPRG